MPPALEEQISQLKGTITEMEAQRALLGDDFVDATLETASWSPCSTWMWLARLP